MAKITPISGFPEWLPEQKLIEEEIIEKIQRVYRSYGFGPIETRSVEPMSILASKGDVNKEIYRLERALAEPNEKKEDPLALHYDLTVPFARYVAQNFNELVFPFKRYQLQKVWRGERPQEGRTREFYQFDADTVGIDDLPLCHDADMVNMIDEVFASLAIARYQIRINNRKILSGLYEFLGLSEEQRGDAVIIVDKINKIGAEGVNKELAALGISQNAIDEILKCSKIEVSTTEIDSIDSLSASQNATFKEGVAELKEIFGLLTPSSAQNVILDLSLARGLDYYTGIIIEVTLPDFKSYGSAAAGGRYENLTSRFGNKKIPGVGFTVGLTRLMTLIFNENMVSAKAKGVSQALITLASVEQTKNAFEAARELRRLGVNTEVFHKPSKFGKQIDYADKKGINWVIFIGDDGSIEAKNLTSKEQIKVSLAELASRIKSK